MRSGTAPGHCSVSHTGWPAVDTFSASTSGTELEPAGGVAGGRDRQREPHVGAAALAARHRRRHDHVLGGTAAVGGLQAGRDHLRRGWSCPAPRGARPAVTDRRGRWPVAWRRGLARRACRGWPTSGGVVAVATDQVVTTQTRATTTPSDQQPAYPVDPCRQPPRSRPTRCRPARAGRRDWGLTPGTLARPSHARVSRAAPPLAARAGPAASVRRGPHGPGSVAGSGWEDRPR